MGILRPLRSIVIRTKFESKSENPDKALSHRNQSIDLQSELMNWFLYDNGLRHERVNSKSDLDLFSRNDSIVNGCVYCHRVKKIKYYIN